MSTGRLPEAEIAERLKSMPDWKRQGKAISRTFDRGDFNASMVFLIAVANAANAANHHPDLMLSWNHVKVTIWTHDVGGITDRDFELAAVIDKL